MFAEKLFCFKLLFAEVQKYFIICFLAKSETRAIFRENKNTFVLFELFFLYILR